MGKSEGIVLFSPALSRGGAERQLVELAKTLNRRGEKVSVVTYDRGVLDQELSAIGVAIYYARRRGTFGVFGFLYRAAKLLRSLKPKVVYSFLGLPNIYAALLKPFLRGAKIVWSIRASNVDIRRYGLAPTIAAYLEAKLSPLSSLIIANSQAGKELYIQKGFPKDKIIVIENGIDTDRFRYDQEGAKRFRSEFAIKDNERIVLLAARLDIMKDHPNFLRACAILNQTYDDLRFVCVGGGDQNYLNQLIALSKELNIYDKTIFTGSRDDMAAIYSSSSSSSSSSFGEGFSNAIAESMACRAICAVTDVGDSAKIVGDLGFVAPPRDPEALAKAIEKALDRSKNEPDLGERVRSSVIDRFSLERMADRTLEALNQTTIAFIITGLNVGGAETTLYKLLERLDRRRFRPYVISLTENGDLTPKFEALGFPIRAINLRNPFNFFALIIALRRIKPDIVHTWMYHADLIGAIAARFAGAKKIAWCIRNSNLDKDKTKLSTRLVVKLCATLSKRLPKTIISCSAAAAKIHEELGYDRSKTRIIPNGFDLSVFKPDITARAKIRKELAFDDQTPLIGLIARYDPQKNHIGFIEAAALIAKRVSRARFVLVGKGIDGANETLAEAIAAKNLTDRFSLIGAREDIPAICAALDVLVSFSSYGEAFPNVLGEAMACGVPCAATDAGDSAYIIGDAGKIVAIGDARALADAVLEIFALSKKDRRVLSQRARDRIEKNFEIGDMVKRYEACYEELLCAA